MKLVLIILFLAVSSSIAIAQSPGFPTSKERPRSEQDIAAEQDLPPEMRARLEIERRDNSHKKILEEAQRLDDLASEVAKRFQQAGRISSEDMKHLSTIEKLAKKILEFAGGSEERIDDLKPASLGDMLNHLCTLSAKVNSILKTETRHVISATLVADSNEAINVVQFIKKSVK